MQRIDILAKSTGTQVYGIDVEVDGMVHAAVKLNPAQGGEMQGFDASVAEKMRGVQAVLPVTGGVAVVADNTWRAFQAAQAIEVQWGPAEMPATMADHWQALAGAFTAPLLAAFFLVVVFFCVLVVLVVLAAVSPSVASS